MSRCCVRDLKDVAAARVAHNCLSPGQPQPSQTLFVRGYGLVCAGRKQSEQTDLWGKGGTWNGVRVTHPKPWLLLLPAGSADIGYRNIQAQLSLPVRGRHRLRRDPHEPVARAHPPVGSQRYKPAQYRAHERVDAGSHRLHLPGYRESVWSVTVRMVQVLF